MTEISTYIG